MEKKDRLALSMSIWNRLKSHCEDPEDCVTVLADIIGLFAVAVTTDKDVIDDLMDILVYESTATSHKLLAVASMNKEIDTLVNKVNESSAEISK
jgi:hypothetical protein